MAMDFKDAVSPRLKENKRRHDGLVTDNLSPTNIQASFTVSKLDVQGTQALLEMREQGTLSLPYPENEPNPVATTQWIQDYKLVFKIKQNGKWKLVSYELLNAPGPVEPLTVNSEPMQGATSLSQQANSREIQGAKPSDIRLMATTLNRYAIANYARQWWNSYNPSYRNYSGNGQGGDCTNFISQALRAGNWFDVSGFYQSSSAWWNQYTNDSWTWINADLWRQFTQNRPRAGLLTYVSSLEQGDILQADFDNNGVIDHSMIVTTKYSDGRVFLTYHTTNTLDRPFSDLQASYPNARWYPWHLHSTIN